MARPDDDGMIECTGCERRLPGNVEHFHRHRDAFKPRCKECRGSSFGISDINKVLESKEGHRYCNECRRELPATVEFFHRNKKTSDGFIGRCKECRGIDFGIHRPNRSLDTPDGFKYCSDCFELLPTDEFHSAGQTRLDTRCRTCSTLVKNQHRRNVEHGTSGLHTRDEWDAICETWDNQCAYCGSTGTLERDHVKPLQNDGSNLASNIVPACVSCNRSKSTTPVTVWYPKQSFYSSERMQRIGE